MIALALLFSLIGLAGYVFSYDPAKGKLRKVPTIMMAFGFLGVVGTYVVAWLASG